ncbi:MAG: hypothetical protein E7062_05920 [Spirochaetaceae bacterium]|nr:hypothetical protein [Spirochaetaceae bacterium]
MCAAERKPLLDLPLKVILTEEGASYFISQKKKLLRFKLADNREEHGILMENFAPQSLQNMIHIDYVSKLEISLPEFVSKRQEIMDLSKILVYSILYKQFDKEVVTRLLETDCVRRHNRNNPSQLLDEKTKISDSILRTRMIGKDAIVNQARRKILEPIWDSISQNNDYTPAEKNINLLMTEKFLNRLSIFCWYIIVKFFKTEGFDEMLSAIRKLLKEYMEKTQIAEYIALMVMELAMSSENANIKKEAKNMYRGIEEQMVIFDPEIRQKIITELERKHELVYISWKIGGGSTSIGKQGRIQITVYNKDDEFQEVKENIETKKSANVQKKSLIDFYRETPDGHEGSDLGMYYLSYLDEACKKVNVKFESLVNQFAMSDLTVINLIFNF